jgi:hypothetical protein
VNQPAVFGGATALTPESAVVSATIDTGGGAETLLPVPTGGLTWDGSIAIKSGVKWADNSTGNYVPLDGIPVSGSNSSISFGITDASVSKSGPTLEDLSNAGADNYSTVSVEYDPVSDYVDSGNAPGALTLFSSDVDAPTAAAASTVPVPLGAFGQAALTQTGNLPLTPDTAYYYWFLQQAGATDQATLVDVSAWTDNPSTQPNYECIPNVAIAADPTLSTYTDSTEITLNGITDPALQGPCVYNYGDLSAAITYSSPVGEFTTPKLGRLVIRQKTVVSGKKTLLPLDNVSAYTASGTIELEDKATGKLLASGSFKFAPEGKGDVRLKLTKLGLTEQAKNKSTDLVLNSNWDQQTATDVVRLVAPPKKTITKKRKP